MASSSKKGNTSEDVPPKSQSTAKKGSKQNQTGSGSSDSDDDLFQEHRKVDCIMGKQETSGVVKYLVKWEGLPVSRNMWLTTDALKNCTHLIEMYERDWESGRNKDA